MSSDCINLFIPSYHRPDNLKTVKYFTKIGYDPKKIHVFIDSEADDKGEYEEACNRFGVNLHVFDMEEARRRYDYVHRPSKARRSAGQARNMFYDYARERGIMFYVVQDDDTQYFSLRLDGGKYPVKSADVVKAYFTGIRDLMERRHIGLFGFAQEGDWLGGNKGCGKLIYRRKVMNTTFVNTKYIYRGERGVQDDDTSQFVGVLNNGLFTGQTMQGLVLQQPQSATAKGGLTDLYEECKLLNKALVSVLQYPSAIFVEKQKQNGGRLHHRIRSRYLSPCIIRNAGGRDNIAWDTYPEDIPFTNEPKR